MKKIIELKQTELVNIAGGYCEKNSSAFANKQVCPVIQYIKDNKELVTIYTISLLSIVVIIMYEKSYNLGYKEGYEEGSLAGLKSVVKNLIEAK